jgi:DNA-binding response OmpR family regulator
MELYYAEDDPQIASIVKDYLEQKNFIVTIFPTFGQLRETLQKRIPTMVLLDFRMPDGRGDGMCQWIRQKYKNLPIIFLTVRGDAGDIVSGFQNGADDYVVKPFSLEVLYARIKAALRKSGDIGSQVLSCDGIILDQNRHTVTYEGAQINLSEAEYNLLAYIMQHKGRTLTRERILEQVWDIHGSYVNDNTLTVTMKRLRDKLRQPPCLITVRSIGYRMEDTI